jgi:hypothetical protein
MYPPMAEEGIPRSSYAVAVQEYEITGEVTLVFNGMATMEFDPEQTFCEYGPEPGNCTNGFGFTIIINEVEVPGHGIARFVKTGVTVMVAVTGALVVFVA